MEQIYNPQLASEAQEKYCTEKKVPHFAPNARVHFQCYRCSQNIYLPIYKKRVSPDSWEMKPGTAEDHDRVTGVTVEKATTSLITGCPHCSASYCD